MNGINGQVSQATYTADQLENVPLAQTYDMSGNPISQDNVSLYEQIKEGVGDSLGKMANSTSFMIKDDKATLKSKPWEGATASISAPIGEYSNPTIGFSQEMPLGAGVKAKVSTDSTGNNEVSLAKTLKAGDLTVDIGVALAEGGVETYSLKGGSYKLSDSDTIKFSGKWKRDDGSISKQGTVKLNHDIQDSIIDSTSYSLSHKGNVNTYSLGVTSDMNEETSFGASVQYQNPNGSGENEYYATLSAEHDFGDTTVKATYDIGGPNSDAVKVFVKGEF